MAMEDMTEPILSPPTRPTLDKVTIKQDGSTETTTRDETSLLFKMEVDDYIAANKPTTLRRISGKKPSEGIQSCPPALPSQVGD